MLTFLAILTPAAAAQAKQADPTAQRHKSRVEEDRHEFIGRYSYGGGFEGFTLDLQADGTYRIEAWTDVKDRENDPTNEGGKSYGRYSIDRGIVVLRPTDRERPKRLLKAPLRLTPVHWDRRLYLIEDRRVPGFCNTIIEGVEPRADDWESSFLLREENWSIQTAGLPDLPPRWKPLLKGVVPVNGPIEAGPDYLERLQLAAEQAVDTGDSSTARKYATELLERNSRRRRSWDTSEIVHDANQILGRAALREGDMQEAKDRLLKAATPDIRHSIGSDPRMILAQELLERGEREVVIRYLDRVGKLWDTKSSLEHANLIRKWKEEIRAGGKPLLNRAKEQPHRYSPH